MIAAHESIEVGVPMRVLPLKDGDLRRAAYSRLLRHAQRCPDTLVIGELGLGHGACRVDIAVINGHIRGLEIKTEADTLERLPRQVIAYGEVVDKASLIVAPRHLNAALTMIPDWWGVIVAKRGAHSGITFSRLRYERINRNADPMMIARLLWRPEAVALLCELGTPERVLRAPREVLYKRLVAELPRRVLAFKVRETLKSRLTWRDRPRPS
jgi:hypothetical protein